MIRTRERFRMRHGPARHSGGSVLSFIVIVGLVAGGCSSRQTGGGQPPPPSSYVALPDTLVCVVDRSIDNGLREIPAKIGNDGGVVLYDAGTVQPLDVVHPINMIAGYAGREQWLARGDPIPFQSVRFVKYAGEHRIEPELLRRVGEHQGILLFAGQDSGTPPDVLYIPTSPGCIFQPFAREDMVNR